MTTDAEGRIRFSGFLGDYEVRAGEKAVGFALERAGSATVEVLLAR
jgi:endo-1,4-beta-xylanase